MLKITDIYVDDTLKETTRHGTPDYPLEIYLDEFASYAAGHPEWHWHDELEFCLVTEGEISYCVGDRRVPLARGEGILINAGRLHQALAVSGACKMIAILFDPVLLSGHPLSAIDRGCVRPLLESAAVNHVALRPGVEWQRRILSGLEEVCRWYTSRELGFEMEIVGLLASAWLVLLREHRHALRTDGGSAALPDDGRVKQMLSLIHRRYADDLSLEDIAFAASISVSECCRCFRRTLRTTPFSYLMRYRILQAARLLRETDASVTDIATGCGFQGASYFGKIFRRHMDCSPTRYRRNWLQERG